MIDRTQSKTDTTAAERESILTNVAQDAYHWAGEHPKTTTAIGLAGAVIAARFIGLRVTNHYLARDLMANIESLNKARVNLNQIELYSMAKTYSDGSTAWFSLQNKQFGVIRANETNSKIQLGEKLSELTEFGNNRTNFGFFRSSRQRLDDDSRLRRVHNLLFDEHTEDILALVPSHNKYLGAGAEAIAMRTKSGTALRIQPRGITERVVDDDVLPSFKVHKGANWQVEELPLVDTRNISQTEIDTVVKRIRSRGLGVYDYFPFNLGRTHEGRVVFVDPGCVYKYPAQTTGLR